MAQLLQGGGMGGNPGGQGTSGPTVGLSPYAYSQTAPLTAQQQQAMQGATNIANQAGNLYNQSGNLYNQTSGLGGQVSPYLQNAMNQNQWMGSGALMSPSSNPYLSGMYDAATQALTSQYQQATAPNILQQAAQSGTLGSAGMAQGFQDAQSALAAEMGNVASNLYGNAYNTGLQATQQANQFAPQMASAQYTPMNQLQNALSSQQNVLGAQLGANQNLSTQGGIGQNYAQNVLDTATKNLNAQSNWPFQALDILGQGLNTASGGGGQATTIGVSPSTSAGK